nr:MAG TPA: hypothetical protein [Caudoviricetes sp.]
MTDCWTTSYTSNIRFLSSILLDRSFFILLECRKL